MKYKVYLICDPVTELYKIGVTKNDISVRIKQLQTGNGSELHLVSIHESKYPYYIERMLHHELHGSNTVGEWFDLSDKENIIQHFKDLCIKYEDIIIKMKDNPFFEKMARIK